VRRLLCGKVLSFGVTLIWLGEGMEAGDVGYFPSGFDEDCLDVLGVKSILLFLRLKHDIFFSHLFSFNYKVVQKIMRIYSSNSSRR